MANACRIFFVVLFFVIVAKGQCQCSVDRLSTDVWKTGRLVQEKPEWKVVVTNPCPCTVQNVKLACAGLQSSETIEPPIEWKSGDDCLVNGGEPIYPYSNFSFNYVWDYKFNLKPISCDVACS